MHRRAWAVGLGLYGLAAGIDFADHLIDDLHSGNQTIEFSELAVAFSAALFWPIDIIARTLLVTR
jgi:hypothetical protein